MELRKTQSIFAEVFSTMGWHMVSSLDSGILRKDEYLFVILPRDLKLNHLKHKEDGITFSYSKPYICKKGLQWHLERNGWLLTGGSIPYDLESFFDKTFAEKKKYLETIINEIDSIINMSFCEQAKIRQREVILERSVSKKVAKRTEKSLDETKLFQVNVKKFPSLEQLFDEKQVYCIISITSTEVVYSKMNKYNSAPLKTAMETVDFNIYEKLKESGAFYPVEFMYDFVKEQTTEWVKDNSAISISLPKELQQFELDLLQCEVLKKAYYNNSNYTSLLNTELSPEEMEEELKLITCLQDSLVLMNHHFNLEQLKQLYLIASGGFDIHFLLNENLSLESMKMKYDDMLAGTDSLIQLIGMENSSPPVQERLKQIAFKQKGIHHLAGCKTPVECSLKDNIFRNYCSGLSKQMLERGLIYSSRTDTCFLDWLSIATDLRLQILRMYKLDGLTFQNMDWSSLLHQVINHIRSVEYSPKYGFLLRFDIFLIGQDSNSVFILNQFYDVVWRAIAINDDIIVNRRQENEICL